MRSKKNNITNHLNDDQNLNKILIIPNYAINIIFSNYESKTKPTVF